MHRPEAAVVEQVFVAASPRSALVLGQARGVALAAVQGLKAEQERLAYPWCIRLRERVVFHDGGRLGEVRPRG